MRKTQKTKAKGETIKQN